MLGANSHFCVCNNRILPREGEYITIIYLYPLYKLSVIPGSQAKRIHRVTLRLLKRKKKWGSHSEFIWRKCLQSNLSVVTNASEQTHPKLSYKIIISLCLRIRKFSDGFHSVLGLARGDLTVNGWKSWRYLHFHGCRLTVVVSLNTFTWSLHVVSLPVLGQSSAQHGGWIPSTSVPESKAAAHGTTMVLPQKLNSVTFVCWLRQPQKSASDQDKRTQMLHGRKEVVIL